MGDIDTVLMDTIIRQQLQTIYSVLVVQVVCNRRKLLLALCATNTPVGQHAFANPMWALQTTNHMIKVRESNTIIQRHINSYFFRKFIL